MVDLVTQCRDYRRIENALVFIAQHAQRQPSLAAIAAHLGLSEFHFQRLFLAWVGITPKRFLQFLTKEHAKALLKQTQSVLDTAHQTGLSGSSRLHDLFVQCEAMTPGEYRRGGEGLTIDYGVHPTPFGECLIALTARGICALQFLQDETEASAVAGVRQEWPHAVLQRRPHLTEAVVEALIAPPKQPLRLLLRGTNFQIKVWESLLRVPYGGTASYESIARSVGMPRAARAVGSAIGRNPIALLIPCHRVIHKIGETGHYRWGRTRKQALLAWEAATTSTANVVPAQFEGGDDDAEGLS